MMMMTRNLIFLACDCERSKKASRSSIGDKSRKSHGLRTTPSTTQPARKHICLGSPSVFGILSDNTHTHEVWMDTSPLAIV